MRVRTRNDRRSRALGDGAHFLRSLMTTPRLTGAVAPSGRPLARAMARAVGPVRAGLVVELGPGTGPVTRALLERGLDPRNLVLVEYDPGFCRMLESRFAPATVIQGDAYDLRRTLAPIADRRIAAVVSSLPLLNQPPACREKLIADAFDLMGPEGVFVQFTYGLLSPIPREACVGRYAAAWRRAGVAQSAAGPRLDLSLRHPRRPARFAYGEARPQSRALQAGLRRQAGARGRSARAPPANPA